MVAVMANIHSPILEEIDAFLSVTGMGASYFGKCAVGNSELVNRLREGRPILNETERRVREFMSTRRSPSTI
jgi:hypothetical protein